MDVEMMTWIFLSATTLGYLILVHELGHAIVAWKHGAFRGLGTNGSVIWVRTDYGRKPPRSLYIMGPVASLSAWPLWGWNPHITPPLFLIIVLVFGLYDFMALALYDRADDNGCIEVKNWFLIKSLRYMGFKEKVVQT